MATDYRVILTDEFDWAYANAATHKAHQQEILTAANFEVVAQAYGLLIAECRWEPRITLLRLRADTNLIWDAAYIQRVPDGLIERMAET